ncbi:MAG TPA: hypothetical protein VH558_06780 [Pseudolabrys sp.]
MKNVLIVVTALTLPAVVANGKELETTHLFGFTLGSDVNDVGEKEAESETTGRFAESGGSYTAVEQVFGVKLIPFQDFSIEPELGVARHHISNVSGLDDRRQMQFDTVTFEMRYRVLNRERAPFGLTIGADPHWGRVDDISGEPVDRYGADLWVIADREIVANKIFAAFNLLYQPEAIRLRATGAWEHQSNFGTWAAAVVQVWPGVLLGAEARYMRSYSGLGLNTLTGQALFVGPTFYAKFAQCCWVSAAWSVQIAGRAVEDVGSLDLVNFERHQAKLRFGYNF